MITNIKINDIATFDHTGIEIKDLKKVNFIYGANGSGKTTISNLLADYPDNKSCSIEWQHEQETDILVYNKKFRDENLNQNSIAGVFTLGQRTNKETKDIEEKQNQLEEIKRNVIKENSNLGYNKENRENKKNKFTEMVWDKIHYKYKVDFKGVFRGSAQKESFKNKLLLEFSSNNNAELLTFDNLKEKSNIIFGEESQIIQTFKNIIFDDVSDIENQEIWHAKIIGKSDVNIAKLIQTLNSNDWVNEGRKYVQEDEICPFCQQETISDDFRKQLENYFDEDFTNNIKKIKTNENNYKQLVDNLINQLEIIEKAEKDNTETKLNIDAFSSNLKTFISQFNNNQILLAKKIKEPSRSIELVSTKIQLEHIKQIINNANRQINDHNKIVNNSENEKKQLINEIWKYIINENREIINNHRKDISDSDKGIESLKSKIEEKKDKSSKLENEIKELTKNITSVQPAIDSINQTLESFEFFTFSIMPSKDKENHYQIQRENGKLANDTLSEGEVTFITFLYFMQLTKGSIDKDNITNDRVLIIDDPISSLDSNVLFIVSTLLKGIIEDTKDTKDTKNNSNIKQIIILTHNVYFHKEVSSSYKRNKQKDTSYWILAQKNKISSIKCYGNENPISTSYELLWRELKDTENTSNISLQNAMRRIIEYYFRILGQYGDDKLIQKFNKEEQKICLSLLCWVNDGSHSISDDLFVEYQNHTNDKYLGVFKKIFELTNNTDHYQMMIDK